jgi:hypothetical protein
MKHFILTAGCKVLPGNVGLQFKIPYILCWNFRAIYEARNRVGTGLSYRAASLFIAWRACATTLFLLGS